MSESSADHGLLRLMRNIARWPRRTVASVQRRLNPAYRLQRAADREVPRMIDAQQYQRLADVPGNTSERQCRLLYHLAATTIAEGCILEIGAYFGKSTAWLAEAARRSGRRLVSIDPHVLDSYDAFRRTVEAFDIESVATLHRAYSHEIGKDWREPIAFLWVDGGHDYDSVRQDIADFVPHVQPGGVVVFDDYNPQRFAGLIRAVDEHMKTRREFEHLGCVKTFCLFRRKHDD